MSGTWLWGTTRQGDKATRASWRYTAMMRPDRPFRDRRPGIVCLPSATAMIKTSRTVLSHMQKKPQRKRCSTSVAETCSTATNDDRRASCRRILATKARRNSAWRRRLSIHEVQPIVHRDCRPCACGPSLKDTCETAVESARNRSPPSKCQNGTQRQLSLGFSAREPAHCPAYLIRIERSHAAIAMN